LITELDCRVFIARRLGFVFFSGRKKTTPKGGLNTAVSKSDRYETDEILEVLADANAESVVALGVVVGRQHAVAGVVEERIHRSRLRQGV